MAVPLNPVSKPKLDGPIPGENYTSNTKNYAWHRPPEITDMDKAIEASIKQLTSRKGAYSILNMLQAGVTIVQATDMFVTSGVMAGKWTVDFAILLAGPVARMMEIMAKDAEITFALGLDEEPLPTISFYKKQNELTKATTDKAAEAVMAQKSTIKPPMEAPAETGGFMGVIE